MNGIDVYPDNDAFWTRMCGIYRHSAPFGGRPGTYRVVMCGREVLEGVRFFSDHADNQNAVCDDFGNLVRVQ